MKSLAYTLALSALAGSVHAQTLTFFCTELGRDTVVAALTLDLNAGMANGKPVKFETTQDTYQWSGRHPDGSSSSCDTGNLNRYTGHLTRFDNGCTRWAGMTLQCQQKNTERKF